jgi:AraC family transcriptional regulator, transcriptional activator of the genes for pyochelin and ferripyochelin receptors
MILLSKIELDQLLDEARQADSQVCEQSGLERLFRLPRRFGEGGDRTIQLRDGLKLILRDMRLRHSIRLETPHSKNMPLVSKFYLSGSSRVLTPGVPEVKEEYREVFGHNYLYYLPDLIEFEEWYSREPIRVVMLLMDLDYLQAFNKSLDTGNEFLPEPLQRLVSGNNLRRFHQPLGQTTRAMQRLLQEIWLCSYRGLMQQTYLESKALELLTLQLAVWGKGSEARSMSVCPQDALHSKGSAKSSIRKKDIERLQAAKAILIGDLENPPSLTQLAQRVGLSDTKLKQGFPQLFGNTVFGYLHEYRLEQARRLLARDKMTVSEVAYAVGFANRGYFAAAFRRKFGLNPSDFQDQCRKGLITKHAPVLSCPEVITVAPDGITG